MQLFVHTPVERVLQQLLGAVTAIGFFGTRLFVSIVCSQGPGMLYYFKHLLPIVLIDFPGPEVPVVHNNYMCHGPIIYCTVQSLNSALDMYVV